MVAHNSFRYFVRDNFQHDESFRGHNVAMGAKATEAILGATDTRDLLHRLEATENLARLDATVEPTMWRCATISKKELAALRTIPSLIRKGRVQRVDKDKVTLKNGTYTPQPDTLYVDCSANSIPKRPIVPVFNGKHITLQPVRLCQQVFSAAFLAHIEASYKNDATKNELSTPIPMPEHANEYVRQYLQTYRNQLLWASKPEVSAWVDASRLNLYECLIPKPPTDPKEREQFYQVMGQTMVAQIDKLDKLMRGNPDKEQWTGLERDLSQARL